MRKRLSKVKIEWNTNFAYAIGLIATDGNLSSDGRHISFTSKDEQLALLYKKCLLLNNIVSKKSRKKGEAKKYYVVQFGDINFYEYLQSIGISPFKSKIISELEIPNKYFADFLRGCIDGDGSISVFYHPESKQEQLKVRLASASLDFLNWIHKTIISLCKIKGGHIYKDPKKNVYTLSYAKEDGGKILKFMYYRKDLPCLERKRKIAENWASGATG